MTHRDIDSITADIDKLVAQRKEIGTTLTALRRELKAAQAHAEAESQRALGARLLDVVGDADAAADLIAEAERRRHHDGVMHQHPY